MKNTMTYKGYSGTVEYSEPDNVLFGQIAGIRDIVSYEGDSLSELRQAFEDSVDEYLNHCKSINKQPDRPNLESFTLQVEYSLYAKLQEQAKAHGTNLNQYASSLLARECG